MAIPTTAHHATRPRPRDAKYEAKDTSLVDPGRPEDYICRVHSPRFARFAWTLLGYDLAVVVWGAYVRATGSGAGCGRHWPLCNGEVIPRAAGVETLVELSHRASSGLALVLTGLLVWGAFRLYPRGHAVRAASVASAAFVLTEAIIGAALVLFELVAHDASAKRALSVSLHLVNTFFLLASTALAAWAASGRPPVRLSGRRPLLWSTGLPLAAMFLVGSSGAVAALGDTLFPPASLAAGFAQDLAPTAHIFIRLRALHPLVASMTAILIVGSAGVTRALRPSAAVRVLSRTATALAVTQVGAGLFDVLALAPVWMQLIHLALAEAVWVSLVLTAVAALSADEWAAHASSAPQRAGDEVSPPGRAPPACDVGQ